MIASKARGKVRRTQKFVLEFSLEIGIASIFAVLRALISLEVVPSPAANKYNYLIFSEELHLAGTKKVDRSAF